MNEKIIPEISLHHCSPEALQLAVNFSCDFMDYMENVPFDLQKNVTKLREVDQKCREYVGEIEILYDSFVEENEGGKNIKRRTILPRIRQLFALCKELGDEKISIVQSISEVLEAKNKHLELQSKQFLHYYEPSIRQDHTGKTDRESKSDPTKGTKRSRRHRNNPVNEKPEKLLLTSKEQEKKYPYIDDVKEPPAKIYSSGPTQTSSMSFKTPALTRAAHRDEDKRSVTKSSKDKKEERNEEDSARNPSPSGTALEDADLPVSTPTLPTTSNVSTTSKQTSNSLNVTSSLSVINKNTSRGKKKKRKSHKHQTTEKQASNSGGVSPVLDMPIDPDEPTYCLCQQVSFGQMIGCDNPKCPIEWFHFSCLRLSHKPKGKWYCPDCLIKMKERKRESKRGDHR